MIPSQDIQWDLLVHVAEQRQQDCARRRGKLAARRTEAEEKLRTLIDHRRACQGQIEGVQPGGITVEALRNSQSLVATLERGTEQQSDRVAALQKLTTDCDSELLDLQHRILSYRVLQQRHDAGARRPRMPSTVPRFLPLPR